jgi:hypothetical protein
LVCIGCREEPVGDTGKGFLLAERWVRRGLKDKRERWRRDEGIVDTGRGHGSSFLVDWF